MLNVDNVHSDGALWWLLRAFLADLTLVFLWKGMAVSGVILDRWQWALPTIQYELRQDRGRAGVGLMHLEGMRTCARACLFDDECVCR